MYLPDYVETAISRLEQGGFSAYAVGGCVRDFLRGEKPHDYDVATSARPEETEAVFSDLPVIETGVKHGTVTVVFGHIPVEITTFRVDGAYSDNRRPDSVSFTESLTADLSRRDFTANAIAYSPSAGFADPFGGRADIENGIIRAVSDAEKRFNEDALRIWRALRFSSVFGWKIENDTARALEKCRNLTKNIAAERIYSELCRLMLGSPAPIIREYLDVFGVIIPEILPLKGFVQNSKYHIYDVLEHTLHVLGAAPADLELRLAALFHDFGKTLCYTEKNGVGHFYGHAKISARLAREVLRRLKSDRETAVNVEKIILAHDAPLAADEKTAKRLLNRYGEETARKIVTLHIADDMGKSPEYMNRIEGYNALLSVMERVVAEKKCFSLRDLAVKGGDLVPLGFEGAEIGKALDFLLGAVIDEKCENEKKDLLNYIGAIAKKGEL